jgi:hypothetical protein
MEKRKFAEQRPVLEN